MRLLHIHSGNMYGGVETLLATLARHRHPGLALETHFALCFQGRLSAELMNAGVPVNLLGQVRISRPLTVVRARRALRELLHRVSFDVVICHSAWSQALFGSAVSSAQIPLVFWLHSGTKGPYWLERLARRTIPLLVLCNSRFTAAAMPDLYPRVRREVIYCPVAPPKLAVAKSEREALRAELRTPPNTVVVIQVSRMESWKGQTLHLEALSRLKDLPGWVCWQVGGAQRPSEIDYLTALKETAVRLGIADRVHFLGQRSDVEELLAAADIHCQPNTGPEPFGIAFIEALYAGLPVVTTALGGAGEIVTETCGRLVPPRDVKALASTLQHLIEDKMLREKLGAAGPARARELCDPASQMDRLGNLLACAAQRPSIRVSVPQEVTG